LQAALAAGVDGLPQLQASVAVPVERDQLVRCAVIRLGVHRADDGGLRLLRRVMLLRGLLRCGHAWQQNDEPQHKYRRDQLQRLAERQFVHG
jgi:hypothetical protein